MKLESVASSLKDSSKLRQLFSRMQALHQTGAPADLLTRLGEEFLVTCFYPGLVASDDSILIIAQEEETLAGFVLLATDMKKALRGVVSRNFPKCLRHGFTSLVTQPRLWPAFFSSLRLTPPLERVPEIIMLSVATEYRRQGVARQLLARAHQELAAQGNPRCLAKVRGDNTAAKKTYEACSYEKITTCIFNKASWDWMLWSQA